MNAAIQIAEKRDVQQNICRRAESLPVQIVFLTMYREEELFRMAINAGVKGYVLKDSAATDIVNCINAVSARQHYTSPELTTYLMRQTRAKGDGS
ncbi:MAG TPA: hypothetical protein VHP99_16295, partial [Pyrinomonadaceae bacterium]|nr:hypothetical protein [Pyrinomonadaceae bacterium]